MTKRLQVLFEEPEWREIQRAARAERTTVADWVRKALRQARRSTSPERVDSKLAAIRTAAQYSFPTAEIAEMNAEIARGYPKEPER